MGTAKGGWTPPGRPADGEGWEEPSAVGQQQDDPHPAALVGMEPKWDPSSMLALTGARQAS